MQPKNLMRGVVGLAALALANAPEPALACPVCFGMLEGPLADGTNKAILVLLGITGCVLTGFATFFIYLIRRARIAAETSVQGEAVRGVRNAAAGAPSVAPALGWPTRVGGPVREGAAGHVMERTV